MTTHRPDTRIHDTPSIETKTPDIHEAATWLAHFRPRLRTCLFGHPHPVRLKPFEDSAQCPLGRWLARTEGRDTLTTKKLEKLHEELHTHAREVLQASQRGEKALAALLLEPGMPFSLTLDEAQVVLEDLKVKLAEA